MGPQRVAVTECYLLHQVLPTCVLSLDPRKVSEM